MRQLLPLAFAAALLAPAMAHAQSTSPSWMIMTPAPPTHAVETPTPWITPTYTSPRASRQNVEPIPRARGPHHRRASVPPPIYVPETGRLLPNFRTPSPSGPRGTETFQDKASRCAHQAGAYGTQAGNRGMYIGSCVNQ